MNQTIYIRLNYITYQCIHTFLKILLAVDKRIVHERIFLDHSGIQI